MEKMRKSMTITERELQLFKLYGVRYKILAYEGEKLLRRNKVTIYCPVHDKTYTKTLDKLLSFRNPNLINKSAHPCLLCRDFEEKRGTIYEIEKIQNTLFRKYRRQYIGTVKKERKKNFQHSIINWYCQLHNSITEMTIYQFNKKEQFPCQYCNEDILLKKAINNLVISLGTSNFQYKLHRDNDNRLLIEIVDGNLYTLDELQ